MLRGVFKRGGLYRCLFKKNGIIKKDLGYYKTDIEAARAYDYEEIRTSGIKVKHRIYTIGELQFLIQQTRTDINSEREGVEDIEVASAEELTTAQTLSILYTNSLLK